ncbi:DUF2489 domain-containing protein [Solimonas sp. K1W22B-7]|nr:DUF2489 domain-containing protein [Solimonas sp. K1W22B-7]
MKRPTWVTNEPEWLRHCAEVVSMARAILSGSVSLTEGARALAELGHSLRAVNGREFSTFVGIASETDAFPVGAVRDQWQISALTALDSERKAVEAYFALAAEQAAKLLIAEYSHAQHGAQADGLRPPLS